ncbi:MAG: PLDc N-terminal domain-containing protein [Candidatus Pacearchaeota archaeon]
MSGGLAVLAWSLLALIFLLIIAGVVFLFVFWILMIVDCAKRKFKNDTDKIVWILVIVLAQVIGAVIYYFVVKRKN